MQCTPQEIEQKRKQAQERLSKKTLINNINITNSNLVQFDASISNTKNFLSTSNDCTNPKVPTPNKFYRPNQNGMKSPLNMTRVTNTFNSKPYDKPKQALAFYGKNNIVTGTCALISEERFAIELSGYSAPAINVFKTIPSRLYDSKTRLWDFHINDYELVQNKLSFLQPDVTVGKLPAYVINCCGIPKPNYSNINLNSIDGELLNALMPFQEQGVYFGIDKRGRCLIADEMGLGKTFQALAIADYYKSDWPVLIATTSTMKNVWEETIHKYIPSTSVMHTQYMVSGKDYIGDAKILIVSHDMMTRCLEKLLERKFGILIVDESHTLKNFKAKCTKAAIELAKVASRVILLSGTPALSRPSELYTQLAIIDEQFFGNFFEYSKRYCDARKTHFGWDASGKSNLKELEIILAKRFMIRRTKEEVLKSLPNKEQEVVTLDVNLNQFSNADRKCLNALADNYNRQKKGSEKHAALLTFFAETAKIKIPSVCSYILQVLEHTRKFIVFAHHQKMLDAVEQVLCKTKKKFIRIDGNTTSDQRKYFVDKFQLDDNYECAILSITAANAGITLTAAKLVVFAELHWNPSILSQAESRAHRIGQQGKVLIRYLVAPNTADDSIWPLLQIKQKILKEAGLFKDSFDNVTVTTQNLSNKQLIAECLQSSTASVSCLDITTANTLDITTYFKSPNKSNAVEEQCGNKDNYNKNLSKSESENFADVSNIEMEFFNDDFEEQSVNKEKYHRNENKQESENFTDISSIEMDFFNDDFEEQSVSKENCHRNVNKSQSENCADSSIETDFFNDDFDEMLSNVEVNI